jgi:hypothetical protein
LKRFLRWLSLLPTVIFAIIVSWSISGFGLSIALDKCPDELRSPSAMYGEHQLFKVLVITDQRCGASWFPATDRVLLVSAIVLSGLGAGAICFCLAPSHKRLAGALSSLLALVIVTAAAAWL